MAINAKRINAILKSCRDMPTPQREVEIVRRLEDLLANPKAKDDPGRAFYVASADALIEAHKGELNAEERALHLARIAGVETGLDPETDAASLAQTVRRLKRKVPTHLRELLESIKDRQK